MKNAIIIASLILLTSCKAANPLKEKPVAESAELLMQASKEASLNIGLNAPQAEDNYRLCLKDNLSHPFCERLIKAMTKSLNEKGLEVTSDQVKDPSLYKQVSRQLVYLSYLID